MCRWDRVCVPHTPQPSGSAVISRNSGSHDRHWTLSVCRDDAALIAFMRSSPHGEIMTRFDRTWGRPSSCAGQWKAPPQQCRGTKHYGASKPAKHRFVRSSRLEPSCCSTWSRDSPTTLNASRSTALWALIRMIRSSRLGGVRILCRKLSKRFGQSRPTSLWALKDWNGRDVASSAQWTILLVSSNRFGAQVGDASGAGPVKR